MSVTSEQFHQHVRENDAAFGKLGSDVAVVQSTLGEIKSDVKQLLQAPAKKEVNGNRNDLIRLLVGALLALAGVGAQRLIGG